MRIARSALLLVLLSLSFFVSPACATFKTTVVQIASPSPATPAQFGYVVASIPDVNSDGVSDIAVGAPGADRVYILSGANRSVIHNIPDPDSVTGNAFGFAVVAVGDVNADGVSDIAVGARGVDNFLPFPCPVEPCPPKPPGLGRAFLFSGKTGALIRKLVPPSNIEYVALGFALAPLGDVNGDGIPDVAVGAPTRLPNKFGQLFAFSGANGSMLWITATAPEEIASFGSSLAPMGDLNSDGKGDLIVGEPFYSAGPSFVGRAHVVSGATGSVIRLHDHPLNSAGKVFSLVAAGIGDQNADGKEDYAVSDPGISSIFLFSGANGASLGTISSPAALTTDFFGFDISASDDRDGDGKKEIWAGAPRAGKVYLLKANGALLLTIDDPTPGAPPDQLGFGWSLDGTPDLGGDAKGDLLIGEPAHASSSGRAYLVLIAENKPPIAKAGNDQVVECAQSAGTAVTLDGSASFDPDGDTLSFTWRNSSNAVVGSTAVVSLSLAPGSHTFTLTVDDGFGGIAADSVTIIVKDTTAPTISVSLTPNVLWPPNHKMVAVSATVTVSDACGAVAVTLVSIVSSEPDNGSGDGNTTNDVENATLGSDDRAFLLRAERSGRGPGRTYTVSYVASDGAGNSATGSATVLVPKNR